MTELLPAEGLQLNPDAVHPDFPWTIDVPGDESWNILDTHPATWQRAAERLVDDKLAGQRIKTAERKAVLRFVADLVAACQQGGTVLSMIQIGFLGDGRLSTAGLHVAWYDSQPDPSSLATVRQALATQGVVEEHETPAGSLLVQRDFQSISTPGSDTRVGMTSLQAFLPLPDTTWTVIVATASAHPSMTDLLHEVVLGVAGSITILDDGPPAEGVNPEPASDRPQDYVDLPAVQAPGIERGFGTMVTHRIDPGDAQARPV